MAKPRRRERPPTWPDWFEPKRYPHFDQPIRDPEQVRWLVESPEECAKRAFLPFIRFERVARKYKREPRADGTIVGGFKKKPRDLKYASHTDSQILRHYAGLLQARYERIVADEGISPSVLAYRRMDPPRCNIHFANEAFEWIERHGSCIALTFDVMDFFESFDHRLLKEQWKAVLGVDELPADHYNVFKAITRYSWVERDALLAQFGITKKLLKSWRQPICTPLQFRTLVRRGGAGSGLIQSKTDGKGIPQGSPISALLSNVYMLPVDRRMAALARERNGLYLRYSDDILLVCELEHETEVRESLEVAMREAKLALHDGLGKRARCEVTRTVEGPLACRPPLQYLGFSFDGRVVRIRSQTVAKFLRRMRKAVRREKHLAKRRAESGGDPRVRRKLLYSRFTHLGSKNFITGYAADAREVFEQHAIREQLRSHWRVLNAALEVTD
ncbi:MAG: antiviral reverse transcriptase Drt2 [Phycisphaerales bacterium]